MQRLISIFLLCSVTTTVFAGSTSCHPASGRQVQVTGRATVSLPPDQASFSVGVESRSRSAAEAFSSNSKKANAVIAALKKRGVKKTEIRTSNLSIRSYTERNSAAVTYIVSNRVTVTRKELSNIGTLIQAAVEAGANQANSLYFSATDTREARKRAIKQAYQDAHDKAQQLASLAGMELGEAVCVTEHGAGTPRPFFANALKARSAEAPDIEAGTQQLSYAVGVVFELK